MQYYQRIRDLREDHDLKQDTVAKALNLKQQQYQLYESGKRAIPVEHLRNLCEFYNISADYILELIDEPRPLK